jgi:hypothetical protein
VTLNAALAWKPVAALLRAQRGAAEHGERMIRDLLSNTPDDAVETRSADAKGPARGSSRCCGIAFAFVECDCGGDRLLRVSVAKELGERKQRLRPAGPR